jgi:Domain of unknown function (DUF1707)/Domain of unknown function (DUF4190)
MTLDPASDARFTGPPRVLAASADRERAVDVLKAGFAEGRLTKAEYDDRMARAYAARTYGELGSLVADLPGGPLDGPAPYPVAMYRPRPPLNSAAVASLVCGIGIFLTMGLTAIPAIVLGHSARREIRATGERGDTMAFTGSALGWAGVAMIAVVVAGLITVAATMHGVHQAVQGHPVPGNPGGPFRPFAGPQN